MYYTFGSDASEIFVVRIYHKEGPIEDGKIPYDAEFISRTDICGKDLS